jgi:predicted metal-binding protein
MAWGSGAAARQSARTANYMFADIAKNEALAALVNVAGSAVNTEKTKIMLRY